MYFAKLQNFFGKASTPVSFNVFYGFLPLRKAVSSLKFSLFPMSETGLAGFVLNDVVQ